MRVGKFTLLDHIVYSKEAEEIFRQLMFVPLRAELTYQKQFEYIGISPLFEDIEEGLPAPEYQVAILFCCGEDIKVEVSL